MKKAASTYVLNYERIIPPSTPNGVDVENKRIITIACFSSTFYLAKLIPNVKAATHLCATIAITILTTSFTVSSNPKAKPAKSFEY